VSDPIRLVLYAPERGTWAALLPREDATPEKDALLEGLFGPCGERWWKDEIRLSLDGNLTKFTCSAYIIETDEDAVALQLALSDGIIRIVNIASENH
jgi:hypothetical protein